MRRFLSEATHISLNEAAPGVLKRQAGNHLDRVFTYEGKPIAWANTAGWKKALKRAGLADFRWHDLRHTWASWHAQSGTPLHVLQEMGDWQTALMVRRYAHLAPAHLAARATAAEKVLGGTNLAQGSEEKGAAPQQPLV